MKTIIYYFSGRGNALKTAMDLSQRLDDSTIMPMKHAMRTGINQHAARVGIVTPVINLGIPAYVKKFIDKLHYSAAKPYIFAVVTNGGMPCSSVTQIEKSLSKKGLELSAAFMLKFGLEKEPTNVWDKRICEIVDVIHKKQKYKCSVSYKDKLMTGFGNSLAKLLIPSADKKFHIDDKCNGCGVCQKVCPVDNIKMTNKKPVWLHRCEQCAACFSWCPKEAITGTNLAAKTRFRNPDVELKQMMHQPLLEVE